MKKLLKTILSFAMVLGCVSLAPVSNTYANTQYEKTFPYVQSYETNQKTMTLGQESRILIIENTLSLNDDKVITNVELISSQLGTILSKSGLDSSVSHFDTDCLVTFNLSATSS